MTRPASLATQVRKAADAARKAGLGLASVKTPDGFELTFAIAADSRMQQDDDPIIRSINNARKGSRRGAAA
jgi:hypothetical protein